MPAMAPQDSQALTALITQMGISAALSAAALERIGLFMEKQAQETAAVMILASFILRHWIICQEQSTAHAATREMIGWTPLAYAMIRLWGHHLKAYTHCSLDM